MSKNLNTDEAIIALAASAASRAQELLADGWVKGRLSGGFKGIETFCIHGALMIALDELCGEGRNLGREQVCANSMRNKAFRDDVEALASAFIVDSAANRYGYDANAWKNGGLAGAAFNDDGSRKHQEVLNVMGDASTRLWDIALDTQSWQPSKWAVDQNDAAVQEYLKMPLAYA